MYIFAVHLKGYTLVLFLRLSVMADLKLVCAGCVKQEPVDLIHGVTSVSGNEELVSYLDSNDAPFTSTDLVVDLSTTVKVSTVSLLLD